VTGCGAWGCWQLTLTQVACESIGVVSETCTHCIGIEVVEAVAAHQHAAAATSRRGVVLLIKHVHFGGHHIQTVLHGCAGGSLLWSAARCRRQEAAADGARGHRPHSATGNIRCAERLYLAGVAPITTQVQWRVALKFICIARSHCRSQQHLAVCAGRVPSCTPAS